MYTSGQIPLDPQTMQIVGEGDIVAQTERVMANLQAVLTAAGVGFEHVVRGDLLGGPQALRAGEQANLRQGVHEEDPPARSTVQVGLPAARGARREIDMIAVGP